MLKHITVMFLVLLILLIGCDSNDTYYEETCTPNEKGEWCCIKIWQSGNSIEKECRQKDSNEETKTEFFLENYIQAPHYDIIYSTNQGLKIQDIDYCRKTTGDSMQPTIFTGNTVCMIKYSPMLKYKLEEGLLVSYENKKGESATHRIKAIYDDYLRMQGDNTEYDEKINYEDIRGIVVVIIQT